jgi:alpha-tubulin suppressor-like RCC1 family protein
VCGDNSYGKLGLGGNETVIIPQKIPHAHFNYKAISIIGTGINHSIYVCSDNSVYGVGSNINAQVCSYEIS